MAEEILLEVRIASREAEILGLADRAVAAARAAGFAGEAAPRLKLALVELVTNAVEHGNGFDPAKAVMLRVVRAGDQLRISVRDEGPGLDPRRADRDLDSVAPESKRGRGLGMVKRILGAAPTVAKGGNEVAIAFGREMFA